MNTKIKQLEPQFAQKLGTPVRNTLQELNYFIPEHYQLRVSLLGSNGKKKMRSNASADKWSPDYGRIQIWFEPTKPSSGREEITPPVGLASVADAKPQSLVGGTNPYVHPAESELLKALNTLVVALDRAESKPGWNFVPLKKFRDEILLGENMPSMRSEVERQNVLRSAIEKKLILLGKVANPKAPEFPVTTIRLNRMMPEVRRVLGQIESTDLDFRPVEIRGEPLSATILRERR